MLKVSDAVREIMEGNALLRFGLHYRLLNLSQVARFIRPMVEARTKKEVRPAAVLMNLSRLQSRLSRKTKPGLPEFFLDKINIHSGLCSLTLYKTRDSHKELNRIFTWIHDRGGFITLTEGVSEITVIIEMENVERVGKMLSEQPRNVHKHLASVGVKFSQKYLAVPGVLHQLMQQVALQNINVVEVASTATEFNIYMDEADVQLAFDSIYQRFARR
jgi:aspartokinase